MGFFSNLFQNYRDQGSGSGLQTLLGSSAFTQARGYDEDHERKWRERFGTGQERTNLDAPQTGLSAAQINLRPGLKGNRVTPGMFGPAFDFMTGKISRKTNNPVEVAGLENIVSDSDGSMYGTDSSPALADYMAPQEDVAITKEEVVDIIENQNMSNPKPGKGGWLGDRMIVDDFRPKYSQESGKLNENISGNIYAKHGGSVFRNAYDQASRIMSGGLEGLRESIDINGQPHNLAYINPTEANLLKVLGGSGRKVNGIPAYVTGYDEGTAGSESWSYDYGDDEDDAAPGEGPDDKGDLTYMGGPVGKFGPGGSFYQGPEDEALGEGPGGLGPSIPGDPSGEEFGRGEFTPYEIQDALEAEAKAAKLASKAADEKRQAIANKTAEIYDRLENKGYNRVETAYFNSMKARGMTNAEAQMAVAQAFAVAGEKTMAEHYETGYKFGGPAETMQSYMEDFAEDHNTAMEVAIKRGNEERDRELAANPDEYDLEAYEAEELGPFSLAGFFGNSLVTGDKLNEFQLQAVQDAFPNATITARSDMDIDIGFYGPWVAPNPIGTVWGIANAVGKIFGENIVGWLDRPGMPTMSIRANGDVRYDTDPIGTDEDGYQIMTERIIRENPIVEEDLTEKEEEEKNSIADLVGLEKDIVERLSLQNTRDILKNIYGPDYEPFTGN